MTEIIKSKTSYEKGMIIRDDKSLKVYRVLSCEKIGDSFTMKIELLTTTKNRQKEVLTQLKDALSSVKMHDKDLFMLENIVATLEGTL